MKLKFWGVRGSIPSPPSSAVIKQKILAALKMAAKKQLNLQDATALEHFVHQLPLETGGTIGGNTTCITIETDQDLIIFDAGSGMRDLGRYLMTREFGKGKGHAHIFFTHTHWDHIQGFPFFVPAFVPGNQFDIYHIHPHVPQVLENQMVREVFPADFKGLASDIQFHHLTEGQTVNLHGITLDTLILDHPGKAYAYRVVDGQYTIVLATDGEYKKLDTPSLKRYIDFYHDADLLIFDAQFSVREAMIKEDWGHSSGLIGADIARLAGVKHLLLFHHDPTSSDEEIMRAVRQTYEYITQRDKGVLVKVDAAREGWEIDFNGEENFAITERQIEDALYLNLSGEFDAQASHVFTKYILDVIAQDNAKRIILDMSNLKELTMAGIRALLDTRRNVYSLAMINIPENVYRIFELAATTDFFAIYDNLEDALNAQVITRE